MWCTRYAHFCKETLRTCRTASSVANVNKNINELVLLGQKYVTDDWTNITPNVISKLGRNLHVKQYHPLWLLRQRIVDYFYKQFPGKSGTPAFSIHDNICPVVTTSQNFDSLLVPKDHPSRRKSDCYFVNQDTLLRAHATAHQAELISMGLNNFLVIGDVYRRDEVDSTHYPVFHQVDAVRLCTLQEIFHDVNDPAGLKLFEHSGTETADKQGCHTLEAVKMMEQELKSTLIGLAQTVFGKDVQCRWVDQYFPFTHPSWELEILFNDKWLEIVGCGVMRQEILQKSGAVDRIGWAFGLGLERLAMRLYSIPNIRLFWSEDISFLNQFKVDDHNAHIQYKPISIYPPCTNDISFWLPEDGSYFPNDFYDLVREIGGDMVDQIILKDEYVHPQTKRMSHCYSIVYRHMERTLTQREVGEVHRKVARVTDAKLNVTVRIQK
ncbi:PREDICTED: probable phenylalanine--tRNA ligase, mitochondrial [Dinoponera quadriceps]|uniref:Phenylalanine--tRNA ligase, mitochondrial n=1 Tax=Dinoponera quadriceps TaxID=609295 RepID=A0A6P3WQ25_DINQU|nr:PREDICTED: probable phenylalanine--tRNA ligase, mitochondrial [Dinoponera quadriceps]XP_014468139.1 PREDICTED: probable phenylalanine--tRNA ligase, mitochondrial [Dinoponera quadriceps]XP_014468140.1 PREDICTED: probable phenylalanine--tRNA ligase, mitochondrial [Dinoponera quadriceps]